MQTGDDARREMDLLDNADLDLEHIADRRADAERRLCEASAALTETRQAAARRLTVEVEQLMPALGMPDATFTAEFRTLDKVGPSGREAVTFVVQLNKGLDPRPVAQVASGGELSRIMLALKVVLAGHDVVQTLVFDEVDQGVGSATGSKIADALDQVAESRQVLVITHLPQIAARASHHVRVTKGEEGGMATATIEVLAGEDRVREIARMLGDVEDPGLLQHARELLGQGGAVVAEK